MCGDLSIYSLCRGGDLQLYSNKGAYPFDNQLVSPYQASG